MKKLFYLTGILGVIALLSSCNPDLNDLDAVGTVENIKGEWHAIRYDDDPPTIYDVDITADPENADGIIISNFYSSGDAAKATVAGKTITMSMQDVGAYEIEGTATVSDDYQKISWQITVDGEPIAMDFEPGHVAKKLGL